MEKFSLAFYFKENFRFKSALIFLLIFIFSINIYSQQKSLPKRFNPVFIKGKDIPIDSLKIEEWFAYSFNSSTLNWHPIPFQMDELDENEAFLKENDGYLDDNDEFLIMPNDAMDRAPINNWLGSNLDRLEFEIQDRQNPDQRAWFYFYKDAPTFNPQSYFQYIPAFDLSAADTIKTNSYKLGHNHKGWTDFVSLSSDWGKDVIDRVKFHINGGGGTIPEIYLTEDTLSFKTEEFIHNPIRSFQKVKTKIFLHIPPIPPIDKEDSFLVSFFPYSTEIGAGFTVDQNSKLILVLLKIKNIRMSIDLSSNVNGMNFFSEMNPNGFSVDGSPDSPILGLPSLTGLNWVMASGTDGTVMAFFNFPEIQGSKGQFIYYRDDLNGGTNEGTPDTGNDPGSFGDMGLWLFGDALVPKSNSLHVSFTTFYIDEINKDADFGIQISDEIKFSFKANVSLQTKPTSVFDDEIGVTNFNLHDAYPNPFSPSDNNLRITFFLSSLKNQTFFNIFDVRGRIIKQIDLSNRTNGFNDYFWDGRSDDGQRMASGIYFYKLQVGDKQISKKLLLVH